MVLKEKRNLGDERRRRKRRRHIDWTHRQRESCGNSGCLLRDGVSLILLMRPFFSDVSWLMIFILLFTRSLAITLHSTLILLRFGNLWHGFLPFFFLCNLPFYLILRKGDYWYVEWWPYHVEGLPGEMFLVDRLIVVLGPW